jgi:ribose transport system permease protein
MASPVVETSAPPGRVGSSLNLQKLTLVYPFTSIVALIVFFAVKNSNFLTLDNRRLPADVRGVPASATRSRTTGIMAAKYLDSLGVVPAILIAIAIGAVVGAVNGVLLTRLKIPSFLVTLGMLSVLTGIANTIANGAPVLFREQGL